MNGETNEQTFLTLLITLSLTSNLDAKCLSKNELTKEAARKQLNKYSCSNIINNITKEQKNIWYCSKVAPKGWANFYSNKLEKLKSTPRSCSS